MKISSVLAPSLCLLLGAFAAAQNKFQLDEVYDSLAATQGISDVAIAPDGSRVAWVQSGAGIFVADAKGGAPRHIAEGGKIDWSPDGRHIAFLADPERSGQLNLYAVDSGGGKRKS